MMKKKLWMILCVGVLTMALTACGGTQETPESGDGGQKTEVTKAPETTRGAETTKEPEATKAPEATATPEATAAPEATPTPLPNREFQGTTLIIRNNYGMNYYNFSMANREIWDDNKPLVEHIVLEDGVTEIPEKIFEGFSSLKTVTMADSVTVINSYAFRDCTNLENLQLSKNLVKVGRDAFDGIKAIENKNGLLVVDYVLVGLEEDVTEVVLPEDITLVADYVFRKNEKITSVVLHEKLQNQTLPLFEGCTELVKAQIPSSYTEIPERMFKDCEKLTTVNIPEGVTVIGDNAFRGTKIAELVLPASVKSVGIWTFAENDALKAVTFQGDLDVIDNGAFARCPALESVVVNGNVGTIATALAIGGEVFLENKDMKLFHVKGSVGNLGARALYGGSVYYSLTADILIDGGVTGNIGEAAMFGCSGLKKLSLAETVTSIGGDAFGSCKNLTLQVKAGSFAESYAIERKLTYEVLN